MSDSSAQTAPLNVQPASVAPAAAAGGVWAPAGFSWALFEFARNPYYMLVITFIFPAYFASQIVRDPVEGQAQVAGAIKTAGLICAVTAPLLGAMMDRGGARKPMMAVFLGLLCVCAALLWFAAPTPGPGLGVAGTVTVLVAAFCAYTYSEVMHNAMLRQAGRPSALPHISGAGLALGQLSSALGLIVFVVISASAAGLGIDPLSFVVERGLGPATAVWLALFVIPFFLYMPDGAPAGGTWVRAGREILFGEHGFDPVRRARAFFDYLRRLAKDFPQPTKYLVVRILYADGITSLLALGGVYTSGVLGWTREELGLYGIYSSVFGVIGGFLAGPLDRAIGARRAILLELTVLCAIVVVALSITQQSILFGAIPVGPPLHSGPYFNSLADVAYLGCIAIVTVSTIGCISSSRSMLVAIAPKERISEFFGLYMLSATATVWIGPMMSEFVTRLTGDQRLGFTPIWGLLLVGLLLMLTVKADGRMSEGAQAPHH